MNKSSRSDDKPLFHWLRNDTGFCIVPSPMQDGECTKLFDFIGNQHKVIQKSEAYRLLYVGMTRAKKTLTITGGKASPHSSTLMSKLLAIVTPNIITYEDGGVDIVDLTTTPSFPVVPVSYKPSANRVDDILFKTIANHSVFINESVLNNQISVDSSSVLELERTEGVVFHSLIERIGKRSLYQNETYSGSCEEYKESVISALRTRGYPEGQLAKGVFRIISLAKSMLNSKVGQWVMQPRGSYETNYFSLGKSVKREQMDRIFEEDGVCWVIDYKTSQRIANEPDNVFFSRIRNTYRTKMEEYKATLLKTHSKVRGAIYLPEGDILIHI